MNRDGSVWTIGLVVLFFLILVCATVLFTIERQAQEPIRPELAEDIWEHRADSVLIGLLRTPMIYDINRDNILDRARLADIIVVGENRDISIEGVARSRVPYAFMLTVEYANGKRITATSGELPARFAQLAPSGEATLPGGAGPIGIRLAVADESVLEDLDGWKAPR